MFSKLFRKSSLKLLPSPKTDRRAMEIAYARLFSGEDGKKVLAHLQAMTFLRAFPAEADDSQLRYVEGQRALVATIMRMIEAGRRPE
ncbi:MAG: hypothetical protein KDJ15_05945 [Alphaproteobacteria bacterium]|nr:hypothetical protein [Alphaproteobacteria bacterium]